MIANIGSGSSFYAAANYNQKKVNEGQASILYTQKLYGTTPKTLNRIFEILNKSRTVKPVFHVSLSFHQDDISNLNNEKLVELSKTYLERMGYAKQPYIIYRHFDTKHPHVHILTSRVDIERQVKIDHNFERVKSKNITDKIEIEQGLTISDTRKAIKLELAGHIETAITKESPENIAQLNVALAKANAPARAEETKTGLIYYRVGEDGIRNAKPYKASYYKDVQLDASSLDTRFANNKEDRLHIEKAIGIALPKAGKPTIGFFSKELQTKGITTNFKVNPDASIDISYQYKNQEYKDTNLKTSAQKQLVFPEPKDYNLREQLTRSIAANEPLELGYEGGKVTVTTPNPALEQELNKRSNRELLALSDIHAKYREEYQQAVGTDIRSAVLALAATDIDDTLQDKINKERLDQRKIKR